MSNPPVGLIKAETKRKEPIGLWRLVGYFLKLGTTGFGGPVALAGYMSRDLVEQRGWVSEKAFVQGATASATGALTGAVVILGQRAIFDLPTGGIALASLVLLWRFKLPEPLIVALSGVAGLCLWLLRQAPNP